MRAELDPVRLDFPDARETEDLESAAVGQNRERPIHEFVQAARRANDVHAWPDIQMVSVAEKDAGAHLLEFPRVERLHAGLSAHRHEHGRVDDSARRGDAPQPGFGAGIGF